MTPARAACIFLASALTLAVPVRAGQEGKAAPANPAKKSYAAARAEAAAPTIDGKLDDPAWAKAAWEEGFIQSQPYEGREPSERTAFKIIYDEKSVYVAVRAYDSQATSIECRLARRDQADGDAVMVAFDSLFDHLTASVFTVNAAGVKADQLLANDGASSGDEEDMSWDPIWDAATAVDADGWTAEIQVPLCQMKFGDRPEQDWGLQVQSVL
jgi:hypothetical protein